MGKRNRCTIVLITIFATFLSSCTSNTVKPQVMQLKGIPTEIVQVKTNKETIQLGRDKGGQVFFVRKFVSKFPCLANEHICNYAPYSSIIHHGARTTVSTFVTDALARLDCGNLLYRQNRKFSRAGLVHESYLSNKNKCNTYRVLYNNEVIYQETMRPGNFVSLINIE